MKYTNVKLEFSTQLTRSNPEKHAVLIIGQKNFLSLLSFADIEIKLSPDVSKEHYDKALKVVQSSSEVVPLHLKYATLARLPSACSRNNTPSQAHTITKFVKNHYSGSSGFIVIVCEHKRVFASACAVARAFPLYSRKPESAQHTVTVEFIVRTEKGEKGSLSLSDMHCIATAAESIRLACRIRDTPCSEMHTDAFLEEIKKVGDALGIQPEIIQGEELDKRGFGGIYGVGKAAVRPPALALLSHTPEGATESIAWVGKGIVYDTGGLSMKTRTGMCGMKGDCGGAAAVLGAFYLAVKMGFKENLHGVFCLAENAVGPAAQRPDDIVTMYSGKTVEVNNTDAEGRLVLGDGVAYAKRDLGATTILDMATLTSAQGSATGKVHGAILTNSEEWEQAVVVAGRNSGDLMHPIIYAPEILFSEFNSQVADMKNSVSDYGNANASCAGLFILSHLGFDFEGIWMHIDMNKPSFINERGTGFGVALLGSLFGHLTDNALLQSLSPKNLSAGDTKSDQ